MRVEWGAGLVEGEGPGGEREGKRERWEVCRDAACGSDIEGVWWW